MEVHVHEILQMMAASERGFTRDSLEQAVLEKFGDDARFTTCSCSGMTAKGVVEFIEARGKLMGPEDDLRLDPAKQCACDMSEG